MSDIFISYGREDESYARELAGALTRFGWSVWYDRALFPSEEFDERIERELDASRCVIVIWSRTSIKSKWVRAEAEAADNQGKLIPVAFEPGIVPPIRFRQINYAKLCSPALEPPDDVVNSLLAELAAAIGKSPVGWTGTNKVSRAGGRSGAKMVTAGQWTLTTRILRSKAEYCLELLPSGIVSGNGAWWIARAQLTGRWYYDSSQQILQLELSGGISEGIQSRLIQITNWENDDTAECIWEGRKAQLKRILS